MSRNKGMLESEKVMAATIAKRLRSVVIVQGIEELEGQRLIQPAEFSTLHIDEKAYQRVRSIGLVNDLIHVLKSGGQVYAPIHVCIRPDGRKFIVDGQQRFWAHYECGLPVRAIFYRSTGPEAEAELYTALNHRQSNNANNLVKADRGRGATLLRDLAEKPDSPYFSQIHFGDPGKRPYAASVLMRGMLSAAAGIVPVGKIQNILARTDHVLGVDEGARIRVDLYLRLVPLVFPASRPSRALPFIALGRTSYTRFKGGYPFPSPKIYERLKKINWDDNDLRGTSIKLLPSFEALITAIW